jgi:mono/diheme cytochrome c family protein
MATMTTGSTAVVRVLAIALLLLVAACSGGNSASNVAVSATTVTAALTGTAATGGPIAGTVNLRDSSPAGNRRTTATASDGSFAFDVSGLTAPFMLRVVYGDPAGPSALYSFSVGPGTANITSLTSIAARAAVRGADLAAFFEAASASDVATAGSRMPASVAALESSLGPMLQRFAVAGNLLTSHFTADHTGVDSMLDSVLVDFGGTQVTVIAKSSGALLFYCPPANIGAGSFTAANLDWLATAGPTTGDARYAAYCAGCHGALSATEKRGITIARLQSAIANDSGKMGFLSMLSTTQLQSIVDALAAPSTAPPSVGPDGAALYATACAGCHGELGASTKRGSTTVQIQNAISGDVGGMGRLSSMSSADIQAIASALAVTPTPPPSTPTPPSPADGATLYASNCAGCHGPLASSTKQGVSIARLQLAISSDVGGMGFLSKLTVIEIQAIVTALTPATPTPTPVTPDGPSLYSSYCAGCHGVLASSTKGGASVDRIQAAIAGNTGGMGSLSTLSSAEVQAIASALASVAPPVVTDGPRLYGLYCANCHGALAGSTKGGASVDRIQGAIAGNTGGMGSLSGLSSAEIQAIASALASVAPPVVTDGPTLYGLYCASCHGALAGSTKGGATADRIQAAINGNAGGMGSLAALSATQVTAIASALALIPPTTAACGSCHAIPPASGRHGKHSKLSCSSCHGVGYSSTSVNAATHNNGIVNLIGTIGWSSSSQTCSNSCHGKKSWIGSGDD